MAKVDRSMSMASRLAAATALTGTLAACDGGVAVPTDVLVNPFGTETAAEAAAKSPRPAAPGNPVYIGGSQATNDALYQQTYGAPLEGSGQEIAATPTFADSVYQDRTISSAPVLDIPGGPAIDAGGLPPLPQSTLPTLQPVSTPLSSVPPLSSALSSVTPLSSSPAYIPEAVAYGQTAIEQQPHTQLATLTPHVAGVEHALPTQIVQSQPVYTQQSTLLPTQVFTDASQTDVSRDIEPLLAALPEDSVPYGSTASHRYSAAEEVQPSLASLPEYTPLQYSVPTELIAEETQGSVYTIAEPVAPLPSIVEPLATIVDNPSYEQATLEPIEVASIDGGYFPMPRARPAQIGPVFQESVEVASIAAPAIQVASLAPIPSIRPARLTTPLPKRRPVQLASLSGKAITDAPALTEPPVMIQVEPVFLDELDATAEAAPEPKVENIETAALDPKPEPVPYKIPKPPVSAAPALQAPKVAKPEEPEIAVAALQPKAVQPKVVVEPKETISDAPRVEIAPDVGDLKELSGTSWRLSKLDGEDVPASAELHFDGGSGFAGGQGICNNYGGEFSETLKGEFDMSNIFSTETQCEHFSLEKKYIVALETASKYRMVPGLGELTLIGPDGKVIANFEAF